MAVVAIAILISFHLKHEATPLEKRIAIPFGVLFWLLSMACLLSGLSNYVKTVSRYARRQALVQSGVGTQVVSWVTRVTLISTTADVRVTGVHSGRGGHHSSLCAVPIYECFDEMKECASN